MTITDALSVTIRRGDRVTIIHRGYGIRAVDCGRTATVEDFTIKDNVVLSNEYGPDPIAGGRAVRPGCIAVARRDGKAGHEGNKESPVTHVRNAR